mmetsp:Transcript_75752/g.239562  ORF Transcript_75752/g.239562 Transcript_75752/m.239562 type:complete len:568 (+) Transcript_75752:190-1893(+)
MHKYRLISKKGEGTFSEVLKAQSIKTGKSYAIKCMKNHFDSIDQVNNLREIQALRRLAGHPNIIKLHEVLYDEPTGRLALVFELMEMNLYEAIKGRRHYLPEMKVKQYMYEVLKALDHMHRNGIFHRDVKPENLLLLDDEIKLADLGSCRGIYSRQPYTEYISTRWYRAPECLLTDGYYNFKMDLFAAGCVWFEIVALFPLFPGQNEMDQIQKIHNVLGTPDPELLSRKFKRNASHMDFNFPEKKGSGIERLVPHADPELVELMKKLIRYDPDERILARQALKDPYFKDFRDTEKDRVSGSAPLLQTGSRRSMPPEQTSTKEGASASSSTVSIGGRAHTPEATGPAPSEALSPTGAAAGPPGAVGDDRSGGLPNIRERRKGGGGAPEGAAGGAVAAGAPAGVHDAGIGSIGLGGGGAAVDAEDHEDSTVLPPIGGVKGKRDSKAASLRTFKSSGTQKPSMSMHSTNSQAPHGLGGMLSNSKGFTGAFGLSTTAGTTSMASTGVVSAGPSTHPWVAAGATTEHARNTIDSNNSGSGMPEKMSSTWTSTTAQPRRQHSTMEHALKSKKR